MKTRERNKAAFVGAVFGDLTIAGHQFRLRHGPHRKWFVVARCKCGSHRVYMVSNLTSNHTVSCGCRPARQVAYLPSRREIAAACRALRSTWGPEERSIRSTEIPVGSKLLQRFQ